MKLQGDREKERLSASGDCLFGLDKSDKAQCGKEMPSIPFKWQKWYLQPSHMVIFLVQMNKLLVSL